MNPEFQRALNDARAEHDRLLAALFEREGAALQLLGDWALQTLRGGGKLLLFGNGGSASHCQHLAAEFTNRFRRSRRGLAALALTTDGAVLTSIANDASYEQVFARQLEALGGRGDLAIAVSTTGNSANVVEGLREARRHGLRSAALLGGDGGSAATEADLAVTVPGDDTARIQEVQLVAGHVVCDWVERQVVAAGGKLDAVTATTSRPASASAARRKRSART